MIMRKIGGGYKEKYEQKEYLDAEKEDCIVIGSSFAGSNIGNCSEAWNEKRRKTS